MRVPLLSPMGEWNSRKRLYMPTPDWSLGNRVREQPLPVCLGALRQSPLPLHQAGHCPTWGKGTSLRGEGSSKAQPHTEARLPWLGKGTRDCALLFTSLPKWASPCPFPSFFPTGQFPLLPSCHSAGQRFKTHCSWELGSGWFSPAWFPHPTLLSWVLRGSGEGWGEGEASARELSRGSSGTKPSACISHWELGFEKQAGAALLPDTQFPMSSSQAEETVRQNFSHRRLQVWEARGEQLVIFLVETEHLYIAIVMHLNKPVCNILLFVAQLWGTTAIDAGRCILQLLIFFFISFFVWGVVLFMFTFRFVSSSLASFSSCSSLICYTFSPSSIVLPLSRLPVSFEFLLKNRPKVYLEIQVKIDHNHGYNKA